MEKVKEMGNKLANLAEKVISICGIGVMALLFALSLIFTVTFQDGYTEIPIIGCKGIVLVILSVIIFLAAVYVLWKKKMLQKINEKKVLIGLMVFAYFFGAVWVMISHSFPVADRDHVSEAAIGFRRRSA